MRGCCCGRMLWQCAVAFISGGQQLLRLASRCLYAERQAQGFLLLAEAMPTPASLLAPSGLLCICLAPTPETHCLCRVPVKKSPQDTLKDERHV